MPSAGLHHGRPAYLYAIAATEVRRVKIGVTARPLERLRALQCSAPCELKLIGLTWRNDAAVAEDKIHQVLAEARVIGEWFDLDHVAVRLWLHQIERESDLNAV